MSDILHWPTNILTPQTIGFDPRPFSRSGGRSLGGIERTTRTDRGYWVGRFSDILIRPGRFDRRRVWNALRTELGGCAGLVVVPICSTPLLVAPGFSSFGTVEVPHDDDTPFDDDSEYSQSTIVIQAAATAPLGATSIQLRLVNAPSAVGIRFSFQHALYETGAVISEPEAGVYEVSIFPAIRRAIPVDSTLETVKPTCLCHLASDAEMDVQFAPNGAARPTVTFVEAVDYWNNLAVEEA